MALPAIAPLPDPPSITDPVNFETEAEAFVIALALLVIQINAFGEALPAEVNARIEAAIAAYDPEGNYSAAQVDALLSRQANDAYFLAMTS